jgi:hypothetical protein
MKNVVQILLTYTHYIVDHTVDIKCLHCGRHCSTWGALSFMFINQKVLLGLPSPSDPMLLDPVFSQTQRS